MDSEQPDESGWVKKTEDFHLGSDGALPEPEEGMAVDQPETSGNKYKEQYDRILGEFRGPH